MILICSLAPLRIEALLQATAPPTKSFKSNLNLIPGAQSTARLIHRSAFNHGCGHYGFNHLLYRTTKRLMARRKDP